MFNPQPSGLQVGDKAPDFALKNYKGEEVTLSTLLKAGPVVLTFYRGTWCPLCNMQLHAFQSILPDLKERGVQLIAISPQAPDTTLEFVGKEGLDFEVRLLFLKSCQHCALTRFCRFSVMLI